MEYKLDNIVNHRIATIAVLMKRQVFKILAEKKLEITPDQWVVLYYLWEENGLSIGELAKKSKKDNANVTRIVDKLIKLKYVIKKRSEKDHRSHTVFITPRVEEIKSDIQDCWNQASDVALIGISNSEKNELLRILDKIESNVVNAM